MESVQLSVSSSGSPGQTHAITMLNGKGWQVLPELGLCLRNERNVCWFHATLNLLIAIPGVRHNLSCIHSHFLQFERCLANALIDILEKKSDKSINSSLI